MKKAAIAVALLGSGVLVAAIAQGTKPIIVGSGGQPVSLASGKISDGNSIFVQQQVYDRLLEFKPGSTETQPGLALSMRGNASSNEWTITLRPGVKFHDGTTLNAAAVKFNFDFWWDDTRAGFFKSGNSIVPDIFEAYKSGNSIIRDVTVTNTLQLRVRLRQPMANFDEVMATGYFGIASPTAIQKAGEDKYGTAASLPVGTGPFIAKSWQTGDRILLEANKSYYKKGLPEVPGMIVRFISDSACAGRRVARGHD
ncbi:MAG: hypothetical protein HC933_18195 [Pleurocapsa sp. SU_196_0]|nr:hypothetical protein [Pleurocapsa sp. SU_196_0]